VYLRAMLLRVTHLRARHDMVKQVISRLVTLRHVMMMYDSVMHAMVRNVREIHV
jgi:hypothetical protein